MAASLHGAGNRIAGLGADAFGRGDATAAAVNGAAGIGVQAAFASGAGAGRAAAGASAAAWAPETFEVDFRARTRAAALAAQEGPPAVSITAAPAFRIPHGAV